MLNKWLCLNYYAFTISLSPSIIPFNLNFS